MIFRKIVVFGLCGKFLLLAASHIARNEAMAEEKSLHLIISGQVQGVFFRVHAKEMADSLHLVGWIKNLADGKVEAYASGEMKHLEKFLEWCHKGPPMAKVSHIEVVWNKNQENFSSFEIVR